MMKRFYRQWCWLYLIVLNLNVLASFAMDGTNQVSTFDASASIADATDQVPEIIIEASLEDGNKSTVIISKEEIVQSGARTLDEVLRNHPGISVENYGSIGSLSTIRIRGSNANQVLIIIDGETLNSSQSSTVDLSLITVDNIEEVQIVKGSSSAVYGEGAFAGAVIIKTSKGRKNGFHGKFFSGYGFYNTTLFGTTLSSKNTSGFWQQLALSFGFSEGNGMFEGQQSDQQIIKTDGIFHDYRNTGYLGLNSAYQTAIPLNKEWQWLNNLSFTYKNVGVPGTINFPTESANQKDFLYLFSSKVSTNKAFISLSFKKQDRYYADNALYFIDNYHRNHRFTVVAEDSEILGDFSLKAGLVSHYNFLLTDAYMIGANATEGWVDQFNASLYGTGLYRLSSNKKRLFDLSFSFRGTLDSLHGFIASIESNLLWEIFPFLTLINHSFFGERPPDFDDLFWPSTAFAVGNADLKTEKGLGTDLGVKLKALSWVFITGHAYYTAYTDLIQWIPGASGQWRPSNIGKADNFGIETEVAIFLPFEILYGSIDLSAFYTLNYILDRSDPLNATYGRQLLRRPFEQGGFSIRYVHHQGSFLLMTGEYVGYRYINNANTKLLPAYLLINIHAGYQMMKSVAVKISFRNILNISYISVLDYPVSGLDIFGSLSYEF